MSRRGTRQVGLPLVVVLHGAFSTAREMADWTGWSALADREGFIVVYPEGGWGLLGFLQHWNAGHCCGKAAMKAKTTWGLSRWSSKTRAAREGGCRAGLRHGLLQRGMLVYRAIAERTGLFAAAAPLAATHGGRATASAPLWVTPEPQGRFR